MCSATGSWKHMDFPVIPKIVFLGILDDYV
jgi:hypothetical protein